MKLALLVVGLLLVSGVTAIPPMDVEDMINFVKERMQIQQASDDDEVELTGGVEKTPEDTTTNDEDGEGTEPSMEFMKELKGEVEEPKYYYTDVATMEDARVINSGDTIALQTFIDYQWLGCAGCYCSRAHCPRMYMMGTDWNNCWGEVFQIYRLHGSGPVRVGDFVGIYFPRQAGRWLGCAGNVCQKATCPGNPNIRHGFADFERWFRCWGEVFIAYSYGKNKGEIIRSGDQFSLFYLNQQRWVAQGQNGYTHKQPCLGTSRPPNPQKHDGCAWETFRIYKK